MSTPTLLGRSLAGRLAPVGSLFRCTSQIPRSLAVQTKYAGVLEEEIEKGMAGDVASALLRRRDLFNRRVTSEAFDDVLKIEVEAVVMTQASFMCALEAAFREGFQSKEFPKE